MTSFPQGIEALPEEVAQRPQRHVCVYEEAQEVRKGRHGDAVLGPGTVVVHLGDASLAVAAVVRPGGFRRLTLFAPPAFCFDDLVGEDVAARVDRHGAEVRNPQAQQQDVERRALGAGQRARVEGRVVEEHLREVAQEGDEQADGGHGEALDERRIADSGHGDVLDMGYIVWWLREADLLLV